MKRNFYKFPASLFFVLLFSLTAQAQNKPQPNEKLVSEIADLRQRLVKAIEKRDRELLETFFADDFTHTHAVGKMDGKTKRIEAILSGDKTLERVQPDEIEIRFYGKTTAIAVGQTTIDESVYRWTSVYVKTKKGWQIAASQASKKE